MLETKKPVPQWQALVSLKQNVCPGKLKAEFFELLVILCSEIPIMSKERFNKDRNFCKSSKCLDNEAMLRWSVARDEFLFIEIVKVMVFGIY